MSVTKETTVWCDEPDCGRFSQQPWTATQIRRDLRERGWIQVVGKDYCPKHADAHRTRERRRETESAREAGVFETMAKDDER